MACAKVLPGLLMVLGGVLYTRSAPAPWVRDGSSVTVSREAARTLQQSMKTETDPEGLAARIALAKVAGLNARVISRSERALQAVEAPADDTIEFLVESAGDGEWVRIAGAEGEDNFSTIPRVTLDEGDTDNDNVFEGSEVEAAVLTQRRRTGRRSAVDALVVWPLQMHQRFLWENQTAILATIILGLGLILWLYRQRKRLSGPLNILVTGAASGLGRSTIRILISRGHEIFAVDKSQAGLHNLRDEFSDTSRLHLVPADITSWENMQEAIDQVRGLLGNGERKLDAIMNFAGILRGGPLLDTDSLDDIFKINVGGTMRANRAFFPLLRRCRTSSRNDDTFPGRIVNIASEVSHARMSVAFNGPYPASKVAVEMLSMSLRQELMLLGDVRPVPVVIIVPGPFNTAMLVSQQTGGTQSFSELAKSPSEWSAALHGSQLLAESYIKRHAKAPELFGQTVVERAIEAAFPPRRILINVSVEMRINRLIPQFIFDLLIPWIIRAISPTVRGSQLQSAAGSSQLPRTRTPRE